MDILEGSGLFPIRKPPLVENMALTGGGFLSGEFSPLRGVLLGKISKKLTKSQKSAAGENFEGFYTFSKHFSIGN